MSTRNALRFQAFSKAEAMLACVSPRYQARRPERLLPDLMNHLLAEADARGGALRAKAHAPEASAAVWVSRIRVLAEWFVAANAVPAFRAMQPAELRQLVALSEDIGRLPQLGARLLGRGIVLVHERGVPGMKLDCCVFRLSGGHVAVGMAMRDGRLDHYWLALTTALAHVVLHPDHLHPARLEDIDLQAHGGEAAEVERLATDSLIAPEDWHGWPQRERPTERDVVRFAGRMGVAPAIVAGRVQRELRRPELLHELVHDVDVRQVLQAVGIGC